MQGGHDPLAHYFGVGRVEPQAARGRLAQASRDAAVADRPHARVVQALARHARLVVDN